MRKERVVVVSALGRWESAKKKTREETIVERARASLAELVETPLRCAPKTFRLPFASVPKKREPQTKKKKWHRNPPRGDASAPTLGDHHRIVLFVGRPLSPKSFPRTEIAVASTPTSRKFVQGARFFFFSALDTTKENALIQHIFARRIDGPAVLRPVRERRKPAGRVRSRRFCFSLRKKTYHFSLLCLLLLLLLLLCGGS